jgi:hypothetical protein
MGRKAYTKTQKVQKFLERNAGAKASEISKATGVDIQYVYNIVSSSKKYKVGDVALKKRGRPRKEKEVTDEVKKIADGIIHGVSGKRYQVMDFSMDMVNSPAHYKVGGIETIDFIEAKQLGYHLGNAVKYISRADHKGARIQDLEKAKWYLDREIKRLSA